MFRLIAGESLDPTRGRGRARPLGDRLVDELVDDVSAPTIGAVKSVLTRC
jgi:hypothetical protein